MKSFDYWDGVHLDLSTPVDFREYDFLELYLYAPTYEPNLELFFDNEDEQTIRDWFYIRNFIDRESLLDKHWHRISIPIERLYPPDRPDKNSKTSSIYFIHMWPGQAGTITFYLDDIRLVKVTK